MAKYKIAVSKNKKQYTIVFEAETENIAKDRAHRDGYSILTIEKIDNLNASWEEFYFEATKDWLVKKWKVIWNDIFKIYLKLKDGLWYDITKIIPISDKDLPHKEIEKILEDIEEQYRFYKKINKTKKVVKEKVDITEKANLKNFYLKKELDETYKLIDFVLNKLKDILENDAIKDLSDQRKEKIKNVYNSIVKIRSSTNISKLKEVWEAALLRVWALELESLEQDFSDKGLVYLKDTNSLLKKIGSNKQFIEKEKDYKYLLSLYLKDIKTYFSKDKKKKKKKKLTNKEKSTHTYLKTLVLLKKYKEKKKENTIQILKQLHIFILPTEKNIEKKEVLFIQKSVIEQNIMLLKVKIDWTVYSYTKIIKGYYSIIINIFNLFVTVKKYLFYTIFIYSLIFIVLLNLNYYNIIPNVSNSLNYNWIFYFLVLLLIYLAISLSRGVLSFIINFWFLLFLIIFWTVNF